MKNSDIKFSVCMSVYHNDLPNYVRTALDSMLVNQTVMPADVVIVRDGMVTCALEELLNKYANDYPDIVTIVRLENNGGLGKALLLGVENAKYDIIARMDSDDICLPDRFEKQLAYLDSHPECDIVGGQMTEFIGEPDNVVGKRVVPLYNEDIYQYMKSRCALNHVTVMFRQNAVLKAGNYQDWFWNEDYYLWVRMMMNKCVFANLPDVLVNVRSGGDQYARRGGKRYFDSEIGIKRMMLKNGMITKKEFLINYLERFIIQLLFPNSIRGWVYRKFARK